MARPQPNYFNDLNLTLTKALDQLARGVHDRHSQFRTPTLVTVSPEGHPAARTVVLRHFDRNTRTLTLHTDRRSDKIAHLLHHPRSALHVYDAHHSTQLRCDLTITLHTDDDPIAEQLWAKASPGSLRTYLVEPNPGTPVANPTSGIPQAYAERRLDKRDLQHVRPHFVALCGHINALEWLLIHPDGQRRSRFTWDPNGDLQATWLIP